jgi:alpha-2-macroglobulin
MYREQSHPSLRLSSGGKTTMDTDRKPFLNHKSLIAAISIIVITIVIGGLVTTSGIFGSKEKTPMPSTNGTEITGSGDDQSGEDYGIGVGLSSGQPQQTTPVPVHVATGEPLTPEEIDSLFSRLPNLPLTPENQTSFKYPVELLPPPKTGVIIKDKFPYSEYLPTPEVEVNLPLQVVRFAPEGEISIAPFISVTFNQAMVPLGTLNDLAARDVPVQIQPDLPGTWRWLGTKTLTFEYDSTKIDRLPKATSYTVTIPAGIKSESGAILASPVTWQFSTPSPVVVSMHPQGIPQPLQPLIFIGFDQRIDPPAVLKTIQLYAGNTSFDLRLATEDDINEDTQISRYVKNAQEGRWLVFKAVKPFPADTSVSITVGPGTPSAEGPLVTTSAQSYAFTTYSPLRVVNHGCYWGNDQCVPLSPFYIEFNNPLDEVAFTEELITANPEIPGMSVNLYGNSIVINGETKGQTTYTITISANLKDAFGQKLGKDTPLTFKVGKAEPRLFSSGQLFVTLDPALKDPVFSFFAINYKKVVVKVYSVQPEDWEEFTQYYREWRQTDNALKLPGKLVYDKTLTLNIPEDTLSEVNIELKPYLKNGFGHFILKIEPPQGMFETEQQKWQRYSQTIQAWVQVTHIGVDAYTDYSDMIAWATDFRDGTPLAGVNIAPNGGSRSFTTGQDGTVRFVIPNGAKYLVATKGADTAMLLHSPYAWDDSGWTTGAPSDSLRWYVFDDRQMYRPGEDVHIKGWLRRIGGTQKGDVSLVGNNVTTVTYQLTDPQGNAIGNGEARVNALGGFDFNFAIPETVNLGYAQITLNALGNLSGLSGYSFNHSFQIQEFRRPEFEVTAKNETTGPYFAGGQALLSVAAKYYAGGALPNADVTWEVTTTPGTYSPPNWPDFVFGEWIPWWRTYGYGIDWQGEDSETETYTGITDSSGMHFLNLEFEQQGNANKKPRPMSVVAQATVMDVNRQAWSSATTLLVHPASLYIGLRTDRYFVEKGTPINVEFIVTDLDGKALSGRPVVISAARLEWKWKGGQWIEQEVDVQTCTTVSKSEPDSCSFKTPVGGSYRISAVVTDDLGRKNQTAFTRWVSGGQRPPSRNIEQEDVTLIPDKENYQPGDTARILVQSPFSPAEGLLTVSRSGFVYTTRFQIKDGSTTLSIPIKDEYIPNLNVQVDLVGDAARTDDEGNVLKNAEPRPAFATAQLTLNIPPLQRTLKLDVTPDISQLEPGGETLLRVTLKDANGKPVSNAELTVVVVDEAILALTNYKISDPISIFYSERGSLVDSIYGRSSIVLANPESIESANEQTARGGGDLDLMVMGTAMPAAEAPQAMDKSGADGTSQTPIDVRTDFNPLATFAPSVRTGSDGKASVTIKVPDNLTRYRIMVVAVDDTGRQFGVGESNLTARLPLMVRPSAPRFLNFGDKFELPVILQNQTDQPMIVEVLARATNLILTQPGYRVTVPANDRIEVRFPASTQMAGTARVQIAAISGTYADAAVVVIPVYTPATTEAFATYGVIDDGAIVQSILHPNGVFPQYGGLEINTSSTALQALTDAVLYLVKYPFECSEQLASRVLAIAALRDVLTAFEAKDLPSPEELEASVSSDLQTLQGLQNEDGGFPYWRHGFESIPFNTIHVAHALYRAEQKGFEVSEEMQQGALNYLSNIESHYPYWYSKQTRWTLSAYALYVRNLYGDHDAQKAQSLINEAGLENLSMEAIGWLWPVIDNETTLVDIRRYVNNHVVETAGAANFTTAYDDQTYLLLSSDRRTDAILLDALIEDNPQSDLIPKVVNGLMAHRTKGRWGNTQENVFVLLTLDRYFNTYESETPDFIARMWLVDTYAGSSEFSGYTTEQHELLIPMSHVLSETASGGGTENIIISKEGSGRLYYRLGLSYAPTDLNLKALDMGFVIQRRYEAVDDPGDVSMDKDGVWHIKAGARVKVHITMVADNRRYHVALVDPLPAGLEIINPALSVSQSVSEEDPSTRSYGWWWWGTWYEHQNLRDDRAEAFTSLLWDGVYEYTYIARATTPGTFIVPPTKAEEMYSPEVFGRSSSDWVVVK